MSTAPPPKANLTHPLTSLIGRQAEIQQISRLLSRPEASAEAQGPAPAESTRCLTLTGAGGSGKTRLAVAVGAALRDRFAHGVCWVDLSSLSDSLQIPFAVTRALSVQVTPQADLLDSLTDYLAQKELLLIVDNCEHLVNACAALFQHLLSRAPGLHILATSREALKIPGETTWLVPLLPVPDRGETVQIADLAGYPGILLFVERARSVEPTFQLNAENASAVVELCQRLDGMPLAIELAAARVKVLTVAQIVARLQDRFLLLKADNRTVLPRYQTLRAAMDWSYDLLDEGEQFLLHGLAVFINGCTLDAIEYLTADGFPLTDPPLDLLTRLVDKSLVMVQRPPNRPTRYTLLETIRVYALEKVHQSGRETHLRRRHRDWFLALAQAFAQDPARQMEWIRAVEVDYPDMRMALDWSTQEAGEAGSGLQLATLMYYYWDRHGYLQEGSSLLQRLLVHPENAGHTPLRAQGLMRFGLLIFLQGEVPTATQAYAEVLQIGQEVGESQLVVQACGNLAMVMTGSAPPAQVSQYVEQGLQEARRIGDTDGVSQLLFYAASLALETGDYAEAQTLLNESLTLMRQRANLVRLAPALWRLGHLCWLQDAYAPALAAFQESLALRQQLESRRGIAYAIDGIAWVAAMTSQTATAARLFGATQELFTGMATHFHPMEQPAHDAAQHVAWQTLGDDRFAQAQTEGASLTLEEAVDLALTVTVAAPALTLPPSSALETTPITAPESAPLLHLYGFGPAQVWLGDHLLTPGDWIYAKARELLFFLLTHGPASREQIGLAFWPDNSPEQLRRNLGVTLHHLRKALGDNGWILYADGIYRFNRQRPYWYDVEAFEQLAATGAATGDAQALTQAIALYQGEFVADLLAGEWPTSPREEYAQAYLNALLTLGRVHQSAGHFAQAAQLHRKAIAQDPFLEAACRELMQCLAQAGERGQALRVYTDLDRLMQREFGSPPSAETQALFLQLQTAPAI